MIQYKIKKITNRNAIVWPPLGICRKHIIMPPSISNRLSLTTIDTTQEIRQ
ncbi:hypothetical protein WH47_01302 [Habropoda laboriosa]|uniref:Uncharacterized protein n=1 Tax=Habropoda laboriosa TaxID=597456 RepID=A0A0L7QZL6_9HYME|nr:hypothetical protein WH47_01302 [Habropoda laboriosa]